MKCVAILLLALAAPMADAAALRAADKGASDACQDQDFGRRAMIQAKLASLGPECEEMCKRMNIYPECQCAGFAGQPASDGDTRACMEKHCQDPTTPCPTDAFVTCVKELTKVSTFLQWDALLNRIDTDFKAFSKSVVAMRSGNHTKGNH